MNQAGEGLDSLSAQIQRARADAAHEQSPDRFAELGVLLRRRASLTRDMQDYDAAVEAFDSAMYITESSGPDAAQQLSNLAAVLYDRFTVTGSSADLDRAAMLAARAAQDLDSTIPAKPEYLSNYAAVLYARFQISGHLEDLEHTVAVAQQALELAPVGEKGAYQANLSTALLAEFKVVERGDLLDRAIESSRAAVAETGEGEPAWPSRLFTLGQCLVLKAHEDGSRDASIEALTSLGLVVSAPSVSDRLRIAVAELAILGLGEQTEWGTALDIAGKALGQTSHFTSGDALMTRRALLAADAAACALRIGDLRRAAAFFDAGRARFWTGQSLFRRDADELETAAPYLAESLAEIKDRLRHLDEGQRVGEPTRERLAQEWDELVRRVRALPGFEQFLRESDFTTAPLPPGEVLVAVNVSRLGTDALVLQGGAVLEVPLPDLNLKTATLYAQEYAQKVLAGKSTQSARVRELELMRTLSWLWDALAEPIATKLNLSRQNQQSDLPVIKWCLSGPLATLPVHAAGRYTAEAGPSGDNLLELAASSYVLSIRDAVRERERHPLKLDPEGGAPNALVVAPEALGSSLLGVPMEVETLRELLTNVDILTGDAARRDHMLQQMPNHNVVHFAGHGHWDPQHSFASGLVLNDGILTVNHLSRGALTNTDLVFLSASSTALGGLPLTNEFISPAAALLATGCPNIIGTCFSVRDRDASEFAAHFYTSLRRESSGLDSRAIACAANDATRQMRRKYPRTPSAWAGFVHATSGNRPII